MATWSTSELARSRQQSSPGSNACCRALAILAAVPTDLPARMPAACSGPTRTVVWGWLQPGGDSLLLQPTMLKGAGLVIGRGQEEYEARQRSGGLPPLPPAPGGPPAEGNWLHATLLGMLSRGVAGRQPPSEQWARCKGQVSCIRHRPRPWGRGYT